MLVVEGRVFFRGELQPLCVAIEEGRIAAIRKRLKGDEHLDFGDDLVLPGGVDLHVHLREPGMTEKEDFASGTLSAAVGGVTTVLDMPNTVPPATKASVLEAKYRLVAGKANVDYGLYAGVAADPAHLVSGLDRLGLGEGLKLYTAESTGGLSPPPEQVEGILEGLADSARPVVVHAEDPAHFGPPGKDLAGHDLARPTKAEAAAVSLVAGTCPRAHVTHLTSREALASARRLRLSGDVTPHHLLFDTHASAGARLKVNPPLRPPEHRAALWEAFAAGDIPILASDHAPHTAEEKARFAEAPSGTPGVATTYPVFLRFVKAGDLALARFVDAFATRPARLFSLNKGEIEVGREADLAVFDPGKVVRVTAKRARYKCGWTAFEGLDAVFPHTVLVRGTRVIEGSEPAEEHAGRRVARA